MTLEVGVGIGSKKVTDKLGVEIGGAEVEFVGFLKLTGRELQIMVVK